jgi:undecaprenyl-diphosphatase
LRLGGELSFWVNFMSMPQHLEIWQAVVLGLVEGITEYLPVSSTGHLIIASGLMGLDEPEQRKAAVDAFNVIVQGGAILAVVGLFWPTVLRMIRGLLGKDNAGFALLVNVLIAFFPAAVVGFLLDDWIESKLFHAGPVIFALFAGGVFMLFLEQWRRGKFSMPVHRSRLTDSVFDMTPLQALTVGLFQIIAMWPGTSRSMMTITGGVIAGLKPKPAAEFSFLLGALTLTAASAYKLLKNVLHSHKTGEPNMFEVLGVLPVVVGMLVAAVSAFLAVKWLVGFLNKHGLSVFGWYRIVLAGVLLWLMWSGVVSLR